MKNTRKIAILGGGPAALLLYKKLVFSGTGNLDVSIFERTDTLGAGMPYSRLGANPEHVTNVSGNEIPELVTTMEEWLETVPKEVSNEFSTDAKKLHEYKVIPRLLFGMYLAEQFHLLLKKGREAGLKTKVFLHAEVLDVLTQTDKMTVKTSVGSFDSFDDVVICTGHNWPHKKEGKINGFFDSPYPPQKLAQVFNHSIAIKGSSLTAIDALRTLSRSNGAYSKNEEGHLIFSAAKSSPDFKIIMHSREGLLPAVRFHLDDPHLEPEEDLSDEDIRKNREKNGGFLSLDYVFEKNFVEAFKAKDPEFHQRICKMTLEEFVEAMMEYREGMEPFELLKAEYSEAEKSIQHRESVHWKEMLAILSFVMNYPAKHFSAEDMQRLKKVLQPLISVVIAFAPQESVEEMMALKEAGVLSLVSVGEDSTVEAMPEGGAVYSYTDENGRKHSNHFKTYIDCSGQPHLSYKDVPFKSLIEQNIIGPAKIAFRENKVAKRDLEGGNELVENLEGEYFLNVPGIPINDNFQVINAGGKVHQHIYMMAVPYIGGYNPDYSGLDFCEAASELIVESLFNQQPAAKEKKSA